MLASVRVCFYRGKNDEELELPLVPETVEEEESGCTFELRESAGPGIVVGEDKGQQGGVQSRLRQGHFSEGCGNGFLGKEMVQIPEPEVENWAVEKESVHSHASCTADIMFTKNVVEIRSFGPDW